jgi:hypothetical protein
LFPFTTKMKAAPPAAVDEGVILMRAGTGLLMVKVRALEVPPPGAGLKTVTLAVPPDMISEAGITAVSCVAETYVVARAAPFHQATEFGTKPLPDRVMVKDASPAVADGGEMPVRTGTGLGFWVPDIVNPFKATFAFA